MKITFLKQQFYLFGIYVTVTYGCGQSEYRSASEDCCPMCNIGMVVLRDCHEDYSTTCIPCSAGTFMDHPNGLQKCLPCKSCDSQRGLYVLNPCTTIRDAQCGVLDGYYCKEYKDSSCISAQKHRPCDPGEEIKTPGNEKSDTVCEACAPGFYSPLGKNCARWTNCSERNEIQEREGSAVEDVQCRSKTRERHTLLFPAAVMLLLLIYLTFSGVIHNKSAKSDNTRQQENGGDQRDHVVYMNPVQESGQCVYVMNFFKKGNKESTSAQP